MSPKGAAIPRSPIALAVGESLRVGRGGSNDLVIDHPLISRNHARLDRTREGWRVSDLGSTNGTYVNGARIKGSLALRPGDAVDLGGSRLVLVDPDHLERRDFRGDTRIEARGVAVSAGGRRLIEGISLTLFPSELVGLMGPSGAGKTTLMTALNGYLPPSEGAVLWNGRDLYAAFDAFRLGIGYVPQDDILHGDLTVEEALYFTAKLRLPSDTTDAEIDARITQVLEQLKISHIRDSPIGSPTRKVVSGGERKRVNLAMELLTDPPVLFLDEPTSGLSSEDALLVMEGLRELADEGRTLLLTIHQPSREVFRLMDNLAVVAKDSQSTQAARLVYYGPAYPEAIRFFNPEGEAEAEPAPEGVLRGLAKRPVAEWRTRFENSPQKRRFIDERAGRDIVRTTDAAGPRKAPSLLLQAAILFRRGFALKRRDPWNTGVLLAQAPIIAALLAIVFGSATHLSNDFTAVEWQQSASAKAAVLFLVVIASLWFGCSNSAREIVAEWAVFRRERMVGLQLFAYLGAKLSLLALIGSLQCVLLLSIVGAFADLRASLVELLPGVLLAAAVGTTLGLGISALARTSEVAISLVPIAILPLVMLGGMLRPVHEMDRGARMLAHLMPSRWAFEWVLEAENERHPHLELAPVVPKGRDTAWTQRADARGDGATEASSSQDLAEGLFPTEERSSPSLGLAILAVQSIAITLFTLGVLRSRDVHF